MQCQRLTVTVNKHFRSFVLKKERILFFIYKSVRRTPQIKFPPSSRVSPTAVPPLHKFEGTHGVRSAWGNTDAIDFVAIASSLRATNGRRAVGNTNRLKAVPLRFVRQLRTQTAQSLVLFVKLDARFSRRLAARVPSANEQTTHSYILSPQPSIATTHGKSRTSNSCTASVPRSSYASTLEFSILLA